MEMLCTKEVLDDNPWLLRVHINPFGMGYCYVVTVQESQAATATLMAVTRAPLYQERKAIYAYLLGMGFSYVIWYRWKKGRFRLYQVKLKTPRIMERVTQRSITWNVH